MSASRSLLQRLCDPFRVAGRRSWFLVQPYSRGDTYLTCALMEGFRAVHGAVSDDVVLIIKESHAPIAEMFADHIPRLATLPDAQLEDLARTLRHLGWRGELVTDEAVIVHPMHMGDARLDALTVVPGFSQKSMYQHLLGLPLHTPLSVPSIPKAWRAEAAALADELRMPAGRSVILMPDANSYPLVDDAFWCELSNGLVRAGWTVYTNVFGTNGGPHRLPFPGTVPIRPSLRALLPLAEHAGWIISTLTGGMNILISARTACRKTVVARGPAPGETLRFNDEIELESAFPYASQATFDGESYEIEEFEIRQPADHAVVIERICTGHNAHCMVVPGAQPLALFKADATPGDLFDRITILEIKESLLSGPSVLHNIRRELEMLRRCLGRHARQPDAGLAELVAGLKRTNQQAWDTNEEIFKGFGDTFGNETWELDAGSAAELRRAESMVKAFRKSQRLNRERVILKNRINDLLATGLREEKSYDDPGLNLSTAASGAGQTVPAASATEPAPEALVPAGRLRESIARLLGEQAGAAARVAVAETVPA
jgi:hypothetical protein